MNPQHKANGSVLAMIREAPAVPACDGVPLHQQRHYHINELAELWGMSPNMIRRWFENEPDVLRITVGYGRGKDHRVCLRIPESVAERVHREKSRPDV